MSSKDPRLKIGCLIAAGAKSIFLKDVAPERLPAAQEMDLHPCTPAPLSELGGGFAKEDHVKLEGNSETGRTGRGRSRKQV